MASPPGAAPPEPAREELPQPASDNPRDQPTAARAPQSAARIEDYALIGDCHSAALVSRQGSIDWLCWPRFDSPACFAALVGTSDNGFWRIAPVADPIRIRRHYLPGTMILETIFDTEAGSVALIDFMTASTGSSSVVRIVEGRSGEVAMRLDLTLRFDYGSAIPWVTRLQNRTGLRAIAGPDVVVLNSGVQLRGQKLTTISEFTVAAGQRIPFALSHGESHRTDPVVPQAEAALQEIEAGWTSWSSRCTYHGDWHEAVHRSLLTLKALTYYPTGGIVAAPTTSLPELLGGERNWDYRFCWLRDATFTLLALMHAGYREEAQAWGAWLRRSVAGTPSQVQTLYGLAGERWLMEWEVPWLAGYQGARPVRIGNAASAQLQLDVYGELMDALYQEMHNGLTRPSVSWNLQRNLVAHLTAIWDQPDESIWEVRGDPRRFTFSKVMAWVAMDRAIRGAEEFGLPAKLDQWRALRQRIHDSVYNEGFSTEKNSFVQYYGGTDLDASLLLMPLVGFLPANDPHMLGTVAAIERELMVNGLVLRYRTHENVDGLPPGEGVFLACSFWLVDNLVLQGRRAEARALFERLLDLRNDVGLLAEEYDPRAQRQLGNFPQAFSHLALINSALNLENHGPAYKRSGRGRRGTDPT
ncbi:MAG TPA: glycoside hydrolase family 15 protein [Acetobacteraceae bacterium]|jgi:GH15 family glucan-1,4-alpha-glucosidase|nr:glycoside hydrolase family 15 protein [Acetobacteraceae bacterium]